jgi:membrane protease YdiL (CAAX protease family)
MNRNPINQAYVFFGLTLCLSWFVFWGPLAVLRVTTISFVDQSRGPAWAIVLFVVGGFVPSLVAIALTALWEGRLGLSGLFRRVVQFRLGLRWYAAIIGTVAVGTAAQIAVVYALGGTFDWGVFVAQLGSVLPLLVLGPLSEELGWRGYALDKLQTRGTALVSSVIVGAVWALWHLPLFYMVGSSQSVLDLPFLGFAVGVIALSILYTWFYNNTGRSIWSAIFFHWVYTFAAQVMASGITRTSAYNWLEYVPYVLIALVVVALYGPTRLVRSESAVTRPWERPTSARRAACRDDCAGAGGLRRQGRGLRRPARGDRARQRSRPTDRELVGARWRP